MTIVQLFPSARGPCWQEQNKHLFRNEASLRWFFRQHKSRLVAEKAVVLLADRWMACEPAMSTTVLEIARSSAEAAATA